MARVTVEDCLENVDNRFELVMLATKRSRQLATGGKEPKVAWENDKPTVVALREIAAGLVDAAVGGGGRRVGENSGRSSMAKNRLVSLCWRPGSVGTMDAKSWVWAGGGCQWILRSRPSR